MTAQSETWEPGRIDYDTQTDTYCVACEDSELASTNVVLSIAALKRVSPTELPPLAGSIDPDALDQLFAGSSRVDGLISFEYAGYEVTVSARGELEIVPEEGDTHRQQQRN